jgi:predicted acetyltransferase
MAAEVRYEAADDGGFRLKLFEGEEAVARLAVGRYTMRVAGVGLPMAGVADVVTHPAHRGKRYGEQMLRAAVARMRDERYPISILFGVPDFYHRFGYAPVLPQYAVNLATRDAERIGASSGARPAAAVRPTRPEDAPALLALYDQTNAGRTGTLERAAKKMDPTPPRESEHWWTHARRGLVAEVDGRPEGYVLLSGNPAQLRVLEAVVPVASVPTAGAALLGALAREAVDRRLEQVRLPLPPDEPLALLLRQAGCKVEVTYSANADGMGRIVDLAALAEALEPALAARALALPDGERPAELELVCTAQGDEPVASATMHLGAASGGGGGGSDGSGRRMTLTLPQQRLCQLVMGYQGIDVIRWQHPDACAEADVHALRALFPTGYPHMWQIDHF